MKERNGDFINFSVDDRFIFKILTFKGYSVRKS